MGADDGVYLCAALTGTTGTVEAAAADLPPAV